MVVPLGNYQWHSIRKCQIHTTIITLEYVIKYGGGYSNVISLPKPFRPYHKKLDFVSCLKMSPFHSVKIRKALRKWIMKAAIPQLNLQFRSPKTLIVPNETPFIHIDLNRHVTGHVEPTIRISVVMRPLNFSFFNGVHT